MQKRFTLLSLFIIFILQANAQNQNISKGVVFDGEPFMCANPFNPNHLVVAWMGLTLNGVTIKVKVSKDGGINWSNATFLPHQSPSFHSADPSMVFDSQGNLYACYIDYREKPDSGGVYVIVSKDGGYSFQNPVKVIDAYADGSKRPLDRPWMTINPVNNELYITTKPAPWIPAPNRAYFIQSVDNGLTWSNWKYVDTTGYLIGNYIQAPMTPPACGKDGMLHLIYPSWVTAQNVLPGFIHASSTNGGKQFNYNNGYYFNKGNGGDTLAKLGYRFIIDPTNANHLVMLHIAYFNNDADVYMVESTDGGYNWTTPLRINDDAVSNGIVQDLVWGAFNQKGDLVITWRDRRNGTGSGYASTSEIYGAIRKKGQNTFGKNFKISDQSSPYIAKYGESDGNDFMSCVLSGDTLKAVWGDVRNNALNIWFASMRVDSGAANGVQLIAEERIETNVYPNPANDHIQWLLPEVSQILIYDIQGKIVHQETAVSGKQHLYIGHLKTGTYYIQFITPEGVIKSSFNKL